MVGFEDYSLTLSYDETKGYYEYNGCNNHSIIYKGSFVHLMENVGKRDFAVLSAYSCRLSKKENISRNCAMREVLQASSLRPYCLVCRTQAEIVVRRYLVEKPDVMSSDEFEKCIVDCLNVGQGRDELALYRKQSEYLVIHSNGTFRNDVPIFADEFVVGVEKPATNMGKMLFARLGIYYPTDFPHQSRKIKVMKSITHNEEEQEPNLMLHDRTFIKRLKEKCKE